MQTTKNKTGLIVVAVFLITGVIATFAYKLQSNQKVTQGDQKNKHFFHPYMQSLSMFIGQSLCLIFFFMQRSKNITPFQHGKTIHRKYVFAIPALADALSSILQYMGLAMINSSTYMMIKGTSIVTTAFFSWILMKMKLQKRHFIGCGLAILGLVIVGSSAFILKDTTGKQDFEKQLLGYILMLTSLVFNGFFYAYEGRLYKQHAIHPFQMVGFEGIFGICYLSIIIMGLNFIPCRFSSDNCTYNDQNKGFMQLPLVYFQQVISSHLLMYMVIIGIISIAVYNFTGAYITKLYDPLVRALLNITKTSIIWIIGIVITILDYNKQYQLQSLNIFVNLIKAGGFTFIILGTLIYQQLIFKSQQNQIEKLSLLNTDSVGYSIYPDISSSKSNQLQ